MNTLAKPISSWVRIPVASKNFTVIDFGTFSPIDCEIIEVKQETKNIPERNTVSNFELFLRLDLLPLNGLNYLITNQTIGNKRSVSNNEEDHVKSTQNSTMKNDHLELKFDSSGNLYEMKNLDSDISTSLTQIFCFYKSHAGKL